MSPSFLRTTPARNPRTECCCQSVAVMIAAIVAPAGVRSIAMMRACLVLGSYVGLEPLKTKSDQSTTLSRLTFPASRTPNTARRLSRTCCICRQALRLRKTTMDPTTSLRSDGIYSVSQERIPLPAFPNLTPVSLRLPGLSSVRFWSSWRDGRTSPVLGVVIGFAVSGGSAASASPVSSDRAGCRPGAQSSKVPTSCVARIQDHEQARPTYCAPVPTPPSQRSPPA